jgi:methylated-DNA-protein-cysteine methyltransferase-like protein
MHESPNYALYERIYRVAEQVPHGMVATYGDIATIVGGGCDARTVGYALNEMPKERAGTVPWQRIINREGGISTRGLLQRQMLEQEGVAFDARDHVIMARFHWAGPDAAWAAANGFHTLPPRGEGEQAEQLSMF